MDRNQSETKRLAKERARKEPAVVEEDDEEEMEDRKRRPVVSAASAARRGSGGSSSGGGGGASQQPCCQAENCGADLTEAKRYHRRHKVCEVHSKAPSVLVAGLRQRFCQQCSRFHELSEFDEAKRSCRSRLAGHNERRRKSSSESQGESSNRCREADQGGGTMQISSLPGSPAYKHFQIR